MSILQRQMTDEKIKNTQITVRPRTSSSSSSALSIKTPRTARFAEATSVNSPIDPSTAGGSPFADPPVTTRHLMPQPQPSDVGFGYMADNTASKHSSYAGVDVPLTPNSPLKSALKPPGTPGRLANPLSPTFKEEQILEKQEDHTEKANAKDVVRRHFRLYIRRKLTSLPENQDASSNGQNVSSRNQFQLQSYRLSYAIDHFLNLQCYESAACEKHPSTLGCWPEFMATNHTSHHCLCLASYVFSGLLRLLARRSQEG